MVRHPVEVFASHRKRHARELAAGTPPARLAWLEQTPAEFCEMYSELVSELRAHSQALGAPVIVCKYETLTKDPKRELDRVCNFIGSAYSDSLLSDQHVIIGGHRRDAVKIDRLLSRSIQAKSSDWREYVSPETASAIEIRLRVELARLEYGSALETY
jgi:hypothetical protein